MLAANLNKKRSGGIIFLIVAIHILNGVQIGGVS
jgi:hypothetical protein